MTTSTIRSESRSTISGSGSVPVIVPIPTATSGVQNPVISLNGTWKLNLYPPREFWTDEIDPSSWRDMPVPGYLPSQGILVGDDEEYAFRCRFDIPADYAGKRIFIRFDGVCCAARLWVNGSFVRSHYGGFTSWNCEITAYVTPGQTAWLALGVAHKTREISVFQEGGIIRDVRLIALPQNCISRLQVETDFDEVYQNATLKISAAMLFRATAEEKAKILFTLKDPTGKVIPIFPAALELDSSQSEGWVEIPVEQPVKWDAEHPNLYTLTAHLDPSGEEVVKQIGFRKIETRGNKLLVNGLEVKLRGVNRHDTHPLTGRCITPELVEQDVRLFRAANVNFIRTSHYPPREDFLDACDRYGIYVEDEIAVAFVYQFIEPTQSDPDYTDAYMGQFSEMVERDRSHACVILWSLANESYWGRNFQAEYEYAKQHDPSRPVIFSYPITIPDGKPGFDIWSLHYAEYSCDPADRADNFSIGEAWEHTVPVLHDEYAHIPCYDLTEQMRDPAVREFWGESIKRFWENIFPTDGALGGAIWAGIDDTIITPRGYGVWEWGIYDGWRREKPEYWLTKKGYSPIRIEEGPLAVPSHGKGLQLPIKNWFDHTNLNEIRVHYSVGTIAGELVGPDLKPHSAGILEIPPAAWSEGDHLDLQFFQADGTLVDAFSLPIGRAACEFPRSQGPVPAIRDEGDSLTVSGADFQIAFDKNSGLIREGTYQNQRILTGGPYLNLVGIPLPEWTLGELKARSDANEAVVDLTGRYGGIQVHFEIRIDGQGLITTTYTIVEMPFQSPRARKLGVGLDVGGFRSVGLAYILSNQVDRLTWERKGLWSVYPEDHIGRNKGTALRERPGGDESYGKEPAWPWAQDMRIYPLFGRYDVGGRGTKDFISMKHNILRASALLAGTNYGLRAESDGSDAVHLEILDHPDVKIDDQNPAVRFVGTWKTLRDDPRNFHGTETLSNKTGDYVEFTFEGSGVCWLGARELFYGMADVYLDGSLAASDIDLYANIVLGTSRGEEKINQQILFSKEGLQAGQHTLRIVVNGRKNPRSNNTYVSVDAFMILGTPARGEIRFNINNEWNYPELTWGNYAKPPVLVKSGYSQTVRVRLAGGLERG